MTPEDINHVAQTVAAVAILVSLVAIYFQMRQGHAMLQGALIALL